jgi:hypothetical protein
MRWPPREAIEDSGEFPLILNLYYNNLLGLIF